MAAITLKNVPDKLLSKLRKTAATNRRSLNQHALYLLSAASDQETTPSDGSGAALAQIDAWRELCGAWKSNEPTRQETRAFMRVERLDEKSMCEAARHRYVHRAPSRQ